LLFFLEDDEDKWEEDEVAEDEVLDEACAARGGDVRNTPKKANRDSKTTDLSEVHALAQRIFLLSPKFRPAQARD
jgi:hypothetical protein